MEYVYATCLLLSIGMLVWLKLYDVRNSQIQLVSLLIMCVSNLGYYFLAISQNAQEAILAQKVSYVGGMFLPLFYYQMVLEICHVKQRRIITVLLALIQSIGYGFVCTIGRNELFYKQVELCLENGVATLNREYGPVHLLFVISMFIYLMASFAVATYALIRKKPVSRSGVIAMLIFLTMAVGVYVAEKIVDFKYEMIPVAFVILMLGTLIPVYDSNLFTVYENAGIVHEQLNRMGFVTFNRRMKYKGCNIFMADVFPQLIEVQIGQSITNCSEELRSILEQIDHFHEKHKRHLRRKHSHIPLEAFLLHERYYAGTIHNVSNVFGKCLGYTVELHDDTEHYQALQLKEHYNEELSKQVKAKTKRIASIQQKTIIGMAQMVESRDLSTGGHIKRTSAVVRIFADKLMETGMGIDADFLELVARSAPMHDIGKVGVRDAVLTKQGKFTDEEYSEMKRHSEIGYRMISEILSGVEEPDFVRVAENVAHYHHEKVNGTGYPEGLTGDQIPIEARIMALADVFDALVSKRCYKDAFSYDKAFDIIKKDSGTHFDTALAGVFLMCRKELEDYYNNYQE